MPRTEKRNQGKSSVTSQLIYQVETQYKMQLSLFLQPVKARGSVAELSWNTVGGHQLWSPSACRGLTPLGVLSIQVTAQGNREPLVLLNLFSLKKKAEYDLKQTSCLSHQQTSCVEMVTGVCYQIPCSQPYSMKLKNNDLLSEKETPYLIFPLLPSTSNGYFVLETCSV